MDAEDAQLLIGVNILLLLPLLKRIIAARSNKCQGNAENVAYFGPSINLLELVFEFFAKAIEQTIVFSNFFHKLFRVQGSRLTVAN